MVGKRDFEDKRCVIFASRSDSDKLVTFKTPDRVMGDWYSYLDNTQVATSKGNSVEFVIKAQDSGVYCWK